MDVFLNCRRHDLCRCESNSLVDHFEATVACTHGDLFGTIRVSIETWLAD